MLTSGRLFSTLSIVLFLVISSLMFFNAPRKDHLSLSKRDHVYRRQDGGNGPPGAQPNSTTASPVDQPTDSSTSASTSDVSSSGIPSVTVRESSISVSTSTLTSTISTTLIYPLLMRSTSSSSSLSTFSSTTTTAVSSDVVRATTEINAATSSTTFTIDFATSTALSSSGSASATGTGIVAAATSDGFWANKSAGEPIKLICDDTRNSCFMPSCRDVCRRGSDHMRFHRSCDIFLVQEAPTSRLRQLATITTPRALTMTNMPRAPFYGVDGTQNYPLGSAPDIILTYAKDVDHEPRRASSSSPTSRPTSFHSGRPSPTLGRRSPTPGRPTPSSLAQHTYTVSNTSSSSVKPVAGLTVPPPSRKDPGDRDSEVSSIDSFYGASGSSAGVAM
ncbi:hypothetical protein EDD18DRAFT_1158205 [Armillaria luteobubalina]|uniref:Uncharacterized protein n=1 Tax=Armillaria luteobubalina TaxID=153913 RepID=A0AA39Q946_9AGAR|nr:hypothetical protein EDD18DRAFT_1158205 [Armillaria luteobubalina]